MLFRIIKTLSTAKISSPEMCECCLSNPQKYIPAKYPKKLSVKNISLGNDIIRSLTHFCVPDGFLESIGASKEIILR